MPTLKRSATIDRDVSPPPTRRKVATTTTNKTVANFFTPASQKDPEKIAFQEVHNSLLVGRYEGATAAAYPRPVKIAAFDFDGTLVTTKSGNKFAQSANDWKWWHASVPSKLKQLVADGYAVVVVSNQSGIVLKPDAKKGDMKSLSNFKMKIKAVLATLELPISVYAATEKDIYRKPRMGMWEQMLRDYGLVDDHDHDPDATDIKRAACVFVGDAAGRPGDRATRRNKDHSCSDRDFAANVGIPFQTPEEYFLGEAAQPFIRPFDPTSYLVSHADAQTDMDPIWFTKKHAVELVLFCGSPGAGKSTFFWHIMEPLGYERVNQDILRTRDKCIKVALQLMESKSSVVVDSTNADIDTRAVWVQVAQKLQVPIRLVHFTAPAKLCEHNDTVRALSDDGFMNPEKRRMLPGIAFTSFTARYRVPTIEEGFEDITTVDFRFRGTDKQRSLWGRYWIT